MGGDSAASARLSDRRFWVDNLAEAAAGAVRSLDADASRHARVLRLSAGRDPASGEGADRVELFDGAGHSAVAKITRLTGSAMDVEILHPPSLAPRGPRVVLLQCLSKGGKLDDIVRRTTELGVSGQ